MRKAILNAALLLAAGTAAAAPGRELALGAYLGHPIGVTGKLWLDDVRAFDFGAGYMDGEGGFWSDFLLHDWRLLPQPSSARLGAYLAGGGLVRTGASPRFGFRALAGLSLRVSDRPLEVFAEAGPLFRLTQGGHIDAVGGLGVRLTIGGKS